MVCGTDMSVAWVASGRTAHVSLARGARRLPTHSNLTTELMAFGPPPPICAGISTAPLGEGGLALSVAESDECR